MKICIFFDGQNFYRSLLRYDESLRVDYDRLAVWITQKVGGDNAVFGGAYYYVGVSVGAPQQVEAFLKGLELRPGYFVKRDRRVRRPGRGRAPRACRCARRRGGCRPRRRWTARSPSCSAPRRGCPTSAVATS